LPGEIAFAAKQTTDSTCVRSTDKRAERFVIACRLDDVNSIEQLFAENAEVYSGGGRKASAA
jgi:hypothetical protein